MFERRKQLLTGCTVLLDIGVSGLGLVCLRPQLGALASPDSSACRILDGSPLAAVPSPLLLSALWATLLWDAGVYDRMARTRTAPEPRHAARIAAGMAVFLLIGSFTGLAMDAGVFVVLGVFMLWGLVWHLGLAPLAHALILRLGWRRGMRRRVAVACLPADADAAAACCAAHAAFLEPVAICWRGQPAPDRMPVAFRSLPTWSVAEFARPSLAAGPASALLIVDVAARGQWTELTHRCGERGMDCWNLARPWPAALVNLVRHGRAAPALLVKEGLDIVLAALLLVLTAPLFALLALVVRLSSGGPVFFNQHRYGLHGKPFVIHKFRTLRVDAGVARSALPEAPLLLAKPRRDPRVTPLGHFLRCSSLDELPQLWNVLKGDMSLVGPRPLQPVESARLPMPDRQRRLCMKPGMTGLWQVSGRSAIRDMTTRIAMDLDYVDRWSLARDLGLLARTIVAVISARGAQ